MNPDQEITSGIRLGVIAVLSAVLTATLVIGAGRALIPGHEAQAAATSSHVVPVIRTSLP